MKIQLSAGGFVLNDLSQIVLVQNKSDSWTFPKGHVEEREGIEEAARREIHEETGLTDLSLLRKLGVYDREKTKITEGQLERYAKRIHVYLYKTPQIDLNPLDPENPQAIWVDIESAKEKMTYSEDRRFFESIKEHILQNLEHSS